MQIKRVRYANVSGFLLVTPESLVLVDTGHEKTTGRLLDVLQETGRSPGDIRLIILTHTHFDHSGGARVIRQLTGAPLAVHHSEAGFLRNGRTPLPRGTRWKGKLLAALGRALVPRLAAYPAVEADILIGDGLDLADYGIDGRVVHTPGHTEGSVSVLLDSGDALVGDNVLGISRKVHFPPFANDRAGVLKSWEYYIGSGMHTVYPAHGGRVQVRELEAELPHARIRYL